MVWEPFVLAVVMGLVVSAAIYFVVMWPQVEPDDDAAPAGDADAPRPDAADAARPDAADARPDDADADPGPAAEPAPADRDSPADPS